METFKLKVLIGSAEIELEGDGELVHTIFQELKKDGLGKLASATQCCPSPTAVAGESERVSENKQKAEGTESSEDASTSLDGELPTLENVVLQGTPKVECDWLLVYATYCSNQGKSLFTRDDLRAKYDETKRTTGSTKKNFTKNIRSLVSSKYISAVNANEFRLEKIGLEHAKSILLDSADDKKGKRNNSSSKKKSPTIYNILDLDLSEEQRTSFKNFWNKHNHSANMDKAVLAAYWLKKEKSVNDFTANHLFTMLRTIEENTSFDLAAAIRNAKNNKSYFTLDSSSGAYKIHHVGEDHVKTLEIMEEAGK